MPDRLFSQWMLLSPSLPPPHLLFSVRFKGMGTSPFPKSRSHQSPRDKANCQGIPPTPISHLPPNRNKTSRGWEEKREPSFLATTKCLPKLTKALHSQCSLCCLPWCLVVGKSGAGAMPMETEGILSHPPGSPNITFNYASAPFILVLINFSSIPR